MYRFWNRFKSLITAEDLIAVASICQDSLLEEMLPKIWINYMIWGMYINVRMLSNCSLYVSLSPLSSVSFNFWSILNSFPVQKLYKWISYSAVRCTTIPCVSSFFLFGIPCWPIPCDVMQKKKGMKNGTPCITKVSIWLGICHIYVTLTNHRQIIQIGKRTAAPGFCWRRGLCIPTGPRWVDDQVKRQNGN